MSRFARFHFGKRPKRWFQVALLALGVVAIGWGSIELWWMRNAKRFQELRPGVLYRTGQPTEQGLRYLARKQGLKTIVTLQLFDPVLKRNAWDLGSPSGMSESEFARRMQLRFEQWPLGDEACWPWPAPWYFEEFFKLLDDPRNRPVLLHCQGGRHRTGTLSALFRLEYDRWPVERALTEMYSFQFGSPTRIQEHNLRTYLPRPHPSPAVWTQWKEQFAPLLGSPKPADFEALIWQLRQRRNDESLRNVLRDDLRQHRTFAICVAQRLIDSPDDSLTLPATDDAIWLLNRDNESFADWAMAAAVIADFGSPEQQADLLSWLENEDRAAPVSQRYQAIVAGVTNRYTPNRVAYLRPLLDDERLRPEPAANGARYYDTAIARMTAILDCDFTGRFSANFSDDSRKNAKRWFVEHPNESRLAQLTPPSGKDLVRAARPDDAREGRKTR